MFYAITFYYDYCVLLSFVEKSLCQYDNTTQIHNRKIHTHVIYIYTSIEGIVYEYCKIDVTLLHWTRVLYSVVITRQSNLFHNSTVLVMNSRVSGQCSSTLTYYNKQCKF